MVKTPGRKKGGVTMDIKEIRKLTGLSAQKFGDKYDIPLRTIQNWEGGVNAPPPYLVKLLERVVKEDIVVKEAKEAE